MGPVRPPLADPTPEQLGRLEAILEDGLAALKTSWDTAVKILDATLTPVAFADPPLLNAMGVHEPFALRSVLELTCEDGVVGLGESYGDAAFLAQARRMLPELVGMDVFDLPGTGGLRRLLGDVVVEDAHGLTGGFSSAKTLASVYSLFEVAALDAQGHYLGRPVVDLLGGRVRDRVDFSAYLFYKCGAHPRADRPVGTRAHPPGLVEQARTMVDEYGFRSIKLKGGVFPPEQEADAIEPCGRVPRPAPAAGPQCGLAAGDGRGRRTRLEGLLEYLEDPTPGIEGMAAVARSAPMPLATNMCVVSFADIEPAFRANAVGVLLSDHHFWGGLRDTQALAGSAPRSASACPCTPTAISGSAWPRWCTSPLRPTT